MMMSTHLKGILYRHFTLGSLGRNLDLSGGIDGDFISSVRHPVSVVSVVQDSDEKDDILLGLVFTENIERCLRPLSLMMVEKK